MSILTPLVFSQQIEAEVLTQDFIEETSFGILYHKDGLPFPFYISGRERELLLNPESIETTDYQNDFDDLNVTIFILSKEYNPDRLTELTPDITRIPEHLLNNSDNTDFASRAEELVLIRNIKYSTHQDLITDSYNQLLKSQQYFIKGITKPFIQTAGKYGMPATEIINEANYHLYDIVYNHFRIREGARLNSILFSSLRRHLVDFSTEFFPAAKITPYSYNQFRRGDVKFRYLYTVIEDLFSRIDPEILQVSDGSDLEIEIIAKELYELCLAVIEEKNKKRRKPYKFKQIAKETILDNVYFEELGQVLADIFGVTRADINESKLEIQKALQRAILKYTTPESKRFFINQQAFNGY